MCRLPLLLSNLAHTVPAAGFGSNSRDDDEDEEDDPLAVFDLPEAEPDRLFVNPFAAYNISPLQVRWQGGSWWGGATPAAPVLNAVWCLLRMAAGF
jgi:hypothetical protein